MKSVRILGVLMAVAVAALVGVGCDDKEVPYVVDADELIRYISESEDAQELFRTDGFINTDSYRFSFDSGLFRDSLLKVERDLETLVTPHDADSYTDYGGSLGQVRDASVWVTDNFTIEVSRTYTDTVLYDTTVLSILRRALFLKLGGDSRPFVGWVLYGFDGIGSATLPLSIELESSSGTQFRGDLALYPETHRWQRYLEVSQIDTVTQGSRIHIDARKASALRPTFQLVSDYALSGPFTRAMHRYDSAAYADSLSYETVTGNPRFYNLVCVQYLSDSTYPARSGLVIPYRW